MNEPPTILIVDDHLGRCATLGEAHRACGYTIESATRGRPIRDRMGIRNSDAAIAADPAS